MNAQIFQNHILTWYKKHGRHTLPWRHTKNPYRILVSEVMLQQTQVARVIPKYQSFLRSFPTVRSLVRAKTPELLRAWQGLGYNRRALHLRDAARIVIRDYGGRIPRDVRALESLSGVGPATARAVAVFSWNSPEIFLETNIRRVYIYFSFKDKKLVSDGEILPIIEKTLWGKNPRVWYWALMDYGAMLGMTLPKTRAENPNRKSSLYARQSRFAGSKRYMRAKILTFILKRRSATQENIAEYVETDPLLRPWGKDMPRILASLAHEGFLTKRGKRWSIAA